jgi:transcriptional regulator with GAF, ATPase, and Fis domain
MTVQGVIWARLWAFEASLNILRRAAQVAEGAGALVSAGQAILTLIAEHGASKRLPPAEVYEAYQRAERLMKDSQDAEHKEWILACARIVMRRLSEPAIYEKNFSIYGAVQDFEAKLIGQALEESGGSVTKAARLLGLSHQTLISMLRTRHKGLMGKRKPVQKRLKSIIKKPKE